MKDCKDKHKIRDNAFGVTWCVNCGRLFTTPCDILLKQEDKIIIKLNSDILL